MLTVISPAKTLDFDSPCTCSDFTRPNFLSQSRELVSMLKAKPASEIKSLMSLSDPLATLNMWRYNR